VKCWSRSGKAVSEKSGPQTNTRAARPLPERERRPGEMIKKSRRPPQKSANSKGGQGKCLSLWGKKKKLLEGLGKGGFGGERGGNLYEKKKKKLVPQKETPGERQETGSLCLKGGGGGDNTGQKYKIIPKGRFRSYEERKEGIPGTRKGERARTLERLGEGDGENLFFQESPYYLRRNQKWTKKENTLDAGLKKAFCLKKRTFWRKALIKKGKFRRTFCPKLPL